MSLLADINGRPQPFALTTLGGRVVCIKQMTAREVAQWWVWVFERQGARKMYDEQLVELFRRLAVDEQGKPLIENDAEAAKLRETPGAGAFLAEFWTEAKRRNFLYQTADEEAAERERFFTSQKSATESLTA